MKRAIVSLLALTACKPDMTEDGIAARAQLVKVCRSGLKIGHDPVSGRYTWGTTFGYGMVQNGLKPDDVC